jgi:exonuclease SbcD
LVRWVDLLANDRPGLEDFCRTALSDVLGKVPAEVLSAMAHEAADATTDIPRLDDGAALLALLKDAEATLLARLTSHEVNA